MHDETITSYLARLAHANRLDPDALRVHVTADKRKTAPVPVGVLCTLSGQSERALRLAIPELNTTAELAALPATNRTGTTGGDRPACRLCAAARGHTGQPRCRNRPEDIVCLRHRRWLSDGDDTADPRQPDLTGVPAVLSANLAHRRLIRSHGHPATAEAFTLAREICRHWHERREHQQQYFELMAILRPGRTQTSATDPAAFAARYPQTVAVTRLLASPHWRGTAQQGWPRPTQFIAELRRTAAPQFRWNLDYPHGPREPLIKVIINDRIRLGHDDAYGP